MTKVLVFGVFDGFHEGHKFFLNEAKKKGDHLIVVLTPDLIVQKMKGRLPRYSFNERKSVLEKENYISEVLEGDGELGSWKILTKTRPNIIALGYDQKKLKNSLEDYLSKAGSIIKLISINSFHPDKFKSSLINYHD